jgi:hypothetical protein
MAAAWVAGLVLVAGMMAGPAVALDLLPTKKTAEEAPAEGTSSATEEVAIDSGSAESGAGLSNHYWLMTNGEDVGFRTEVEINGQPVGSMKKPGETLEVTQHLHPGLNKIRLVSSDNARKSTSKSPESQMSITLGPEGSREKQGTFSRTFIQLKEMIVHYLRPAAYRAEESAVELAFTLREEPNPNLTKRYHLYSQGVFTGHVIHVAINGVPFLDLAGPGAHIDLNPYLEKGKNEITFSSSRIEGTPFTPAEREALKDKSFEVGIAVAGDYDPATYDQPVTQVTSFLARYVQAADMDEPEPIEKATIDAQ